MLGRYIDDTTSPTRFAMSTLQQEALQAIRELGGDSQDLLQQIVQLYFDAAPGLLQQMNSGFASGDLAAIRNAAHSLKSSSANLGATELSKMCGQLEAAARTGAIGADAPSAQAIETEYESVESALLAELA
jgi:HPt (histidine-containing phosphotransfer) domain-containing protein